MLNKIFFFFDFFSNLKKCKLILLTFNTITVIVYSQDYHRINSKKCQFRCFFHISFFSVYCNPY